MLELKGRALFYQLPANAEGVLKTLERDNVAKQYRNIDHAEGSRRIIRDWIEAQLAIVDAGQAQLAEVFLPYAIAKDGRTLYQHIEDGTVKLLN